MMPIANAVVDAKHAMLENTKSNRHIETYIFLRSREELGTPYVVTEIENQGPTVLACGYNSSIITLC